MIDHGPQERGEHEKYANHAKYDCRVREKENFDQDKCYSENKECNNFPAGEPGQIMTKEK